MSDDDCAICGDPMFDAEGEPMIEEEDDEKEGKKKGDIKKVVQLPCNHMFHRTCMQRWIREQPPAKCPICREKFEPSAETMKQVDDKASAVPVERLPQPPPGAITFLKGTAARFEGKLEDFKNYVIAFLGSRYELSDVLLNRIFDEVHQKTSGGKRYRSTRRNMKRRRSTRRKKSLRRRH